MTDDAWVRMFPGGHDYSRPMRETSLGFFDKYLRGVGDGIAVWERTYCCRILRSFSFFPPLRQRR